MKSVIYIRVSTEEQRDGYSPEAQLANTQRRAELEGFRVTKVYEDLGISGTHDNRPALQEMLNDLRRSSKRQRPTALIVDHTDRLSRNLRILLNITEELDKLGITLYTSKGKVDTESDTGIMMFQIGGMFAEQYTRNLAREVKKGLREKARQGHWVGGICPYGYKRVDKDTIVPAGDASTEAVKRIFELYATKAYSIVKVCDQINLLAGYWGRSFGAESVRDILKNRAYCGYVSSGGEEFPGKHEAIISEEQWQHCAEVRAARSRGRRNAAKASHDGPTTLLVGGIGRCFICGQPLWTSNSGRSKNSAYYRCAGYSRRNCTERRQHNATSIDAQVLELLRGFSLAVEYHAEAIEELMHQQPLQQPQRPKIDPAVIQAKLDRLSLAWINGNISAEMYEAHMQQLKIQLHAAENEAAHTVQQTAGFMDLEKARLLLNDLSSVIDQATLHEQRQLVHLVFEHIDVSNKHIQGVQPKKMYGMLLIAARRTRIRASGKRGSNPQPSVWETDALPLRHSRNSV